MAKPPVNWNNVDMLTPGMKNLGNQFNKAWPNRDGTTDGAIGDYAHSQGTSGHNPDDTSHDNAEWDSDSDNTSEVRAIDVDKDLNSSGTSMQDVIDHMRGLKDLSSVIRYMIYNKKIYSASNGFNPENYSGSNSHTEHAHFSGAYTQSSDQNTTYDYRFDEVNMPTVDEIWNKKFQDPYDTSDNPRMVAAYNWLRYVPSDQDVRNVRDEVKEVQATLAAQQEQLDRIECLLGGNPDD